jgi:ABC-2 type transport system permease protein
MAEGVVFDLGYQPHDGPRLGRSGARRALVKDGLRRVLGLRRKARRKVLPVILMSIAVMPALFFTAFAVVAGEFDISETIFGHADYFDLNGSMALIFVALAASELLIPDRVHGTMAIYASRPLTTPDYVAGRAISLAIVVFSFLWIPHLVLFAGRAWVSDQGFGSYATGHLEILWQTAVVSLVYFVAYTSIAFLIAAFSKRTAVAAGVFLGTVMMSGATGALVEAGYKFFGLGAVLDHPGYVKDWILGSSGGDWIPETAGLEPIMSLVVIIVLAIATGLVVVGRYRKAA